MKKLFLVWCALFVGTMLYAGGPDAQGDWSIFVQIKERGREGKRLYWKFLGPNGMKRETFQKHVECSFLKDHPGTENVKLGNFQSLPEVLTADTLRERRSKTRLVIEYGAPSNEHERDETKAE